MTDTLLLVGTLAIVVERAIEPINNLLKNTLFKGKDPSHLLWRRVIAMLLGTAAGVVIAEPMNLDLVTSLAGASIHGGQFLTGLIIGLGTGPAHEVIKYVEEKKNKAKEEARAAQII